MPAIIPANLQIAFASVNPALTALYAQQAKDMVWSAVSTEMPAATRTVVLPYMDRIAKMRLWVGARQVNFPAVEQYTVTVQPFENTQGIDLWALADDQYSVYGPQMQMLVSSAVENPEYQLRDLIENTGAQTGSRQFGYDGLAHWSTAHPVDVYNAAEGTYCNDFGTAGVSLGTPSATVGGYLNPTTYASVLAYAKTIKRQDGEIYGVSPDTLMVPTSLETMGQAILQTQYLASPTIGSAWGQLTGQVGTADNVLARQGVNLLVNKRLTNTKAWYVLDTGQVVKPFLRVVHEAPVFTARNQPQDPVVFDLHSALYGVHSQECPAWGPSFLSFRSGV